MASITIRNLDEAAKQALRERAARNGRSMEEEARLLLTGSGTVSAQRASASNKEPASTATPISASLVASTPQDQRLTGKRILLIIAGGIAAYKCLDLIRRLRERGAEIRCVMTKGAQEFITPLTVGALTADKVFSDLFSREDEHDVGHIRLSREADLLVVAPATADLMAKMAGGHADDLASTVLIATNKPVLIAPAMNPQMWNHPATRRNENTLREDGIAFIGPNAGEMAESGEAGFGRMAEPMEIVGAIEVMLDDRPKPLAGKRVVITSGPTHEPIDPVRYIANRSSGKQGHAVAAAFADAGAEVILVSGPTQLADPAQCEVVRVESARDMKTAVETALPADIGVFVAAVADWRVERSADEKIKKKKGAAAPTLRMAENPDILKGIGTRKKGRPDLVVGFAAETRDVVKFGIAKLKEKGADWIVANDVSPESGTFGGDTNKVKLISKDGVEDWPEMSKRDVAEEIVAKAVRFFETQTIEV